MHLLTKNPLTNIELTFTDPIRGPAPLRARQLRGAVAAAFPDDDLFHQHDGNGRPLYRYPRIQYRWRRGKGIVIGWSEAASRLLNLPWLDLDLNLGGETARVSDAAINMKTGEFGVSDRLLHYRFLSPALLLNQKNYASYREMDQNEQRRELDRLLVAQLLVAMRELGVNFEGRLYAAMMYAKPQPCRYKEQDLLGFVGRFTTNAALPSGLAIGHAVSHGYGWLESAD